MGGEIELRFADDGLVRRITTYERDYEYPTDVRVELDRGLLWVATADRGTFPFRVAHIHRYDLRMRTGRTIELDPDELPEGCPVQVVR